MNGPQEGRPAVMYFTDGHIGTGHIATWCAINKSLEEVAQLTYVYGHCGFGHFSNFPMQLLNEREMRTEFRKLDPKLILVDQNLRAYHEMFGPTKLDLWVLVRATTEEWFRENVEQLLQEFPNARVIATEPCAWKFSEVTVNPIVLWDRSEMLPPDELRRKFGVPTGWIGAVMHSGAPGEFDELFDMPEVDEHLRNCEWIVKLNGHDLSNPARTSGARYLSGASRIVCAAGYNAFWEANWLGYADRCMFVPLTGVRVIPEQEIRLAETPATFTMHENGADQMAEKIYLKLAALGVL